MSAGKVLTWAYKWLPIICGCHCRADRSFYFKGHQFPVCARCTGILTGWLTGIAACFFIRVSLCWLVVMMLPLIIDGTVQRLTRYESGNLRRFVTGSFFGYAAMSLFLRSLEMAYLAGAHAGCVIFS